MIEIRDRQGTVIYVYPESEGLDFDSADLHGLDLSGGVLEGADFSDANLSGINFENADLYWAKFFRANLTDANLRQTILCGSNMKLAKLTNADLREANLGRDNVGGSTQLQGANLSGCLIQGANFEHAAYDSTTKLPKHLNPEDHNMIFVDPY